MPPPPYHFNFYLGGGGYFVWMGLNFLWLIFYNASIHDKITLSTFCVVIITIKNFYNFEDGINEILS